MCTGFVYFQEYQVSCYLLLFMAASEFHVPVKTKDSKLLF
uniref:Uncharacterized protein n=1 Tax=Arundo donax TaxID=35708 RepID=A0A0A9HSD1_ARUDO